MKCFVMQKFIKVCFLISMTIVIGQISANERKPNTKMLRKDIKKVLKHDIFLSQEERNHLYELDQAIRQERRVHRKERFIKFCSGLSDTILKALDIATNPTILNLISPGSSSNNHLPRS